MKKYAVIVAGGSGNRMGAEIPKQFLRLNGKQVLNHSIGTFLRAYPDLEVILVLPAAARSLWAMEDLSPRDLERIRIRDGGATRFDSVRNGLAAINEDSIIFVHDAVRCLLSISLIHRCYEQALAKGSAIPAIASKDSIRLLVENGSQAFDRNKVMLVQTPQTFQSSILLSAFEKGYEDRFTDEATVVEACGGKVELIEGEERNIKITRPVDLVIAESLLGQETH